MGWTRWNWHFPNNGHNHLDEEFLASANLSLLPSLSRSNFVLVIMDPLGIAVSKQPRAAPFATDAALLVAGQVPLREGLLEAVDPDGSRVDLLGQAVRPVDVAGPDGSAEAGVGVVDAGDDFVFGAPGEDGDDGACSGLLARYSTK